MWTRAVTGNPLHSGHGGEGPRSGQRQGRQVGKWEKWAPWTCRKEGLIRCRELMATDWENKNKKQEDVKGKQSVVRANTNTESGVRGPTEMPGGRGGQRAHGMTRDDSI